MNCFLTTTIKDPLRGGICTAGSRTLLQYGTLLSTLYYYKRKHTLTTTTSTYQKGHCNHDGHRDWKVEGRCTKSSEEEEDSNENLSVPAVDRGKVSCSPNLEDHRSNLFLWCTSGTILQAPDRKYLYRYDSRRESTARSAIFKLTHVV